MQRQPEQIESTPRGCLFDFGRLALGAVCWLGASQLFGLLHPWGVLVGLFALPMSFQLGATCAGILMLVQMGWRGLFWAMKLPFRFVARRPLISADERGVFDTRPAVTFAGFVLGCGIGGALAGLVLSFGSHAEFGVLASTGAGAAIMAAACGLILSLKLDFTSE